MDTCTLRWTGYTINVVAIGTISGDSVPVTTPGIALPAEGTPIDIWPGFDGFQEFDYDVDGTLLKKIELLLWDLGNSVCGEHRLRHAQELLLPQLQAIVFGCSTGHRFDLRILRAVRIIASQHSSVSAVPPLRSSRSTRRHRPSPKAPTSR